MGLTRTPPVPQDAEAAHRQGKPQDVAGLLRMRPIIRMVIAGIDKDNRRTRWTPQDEAEWYGLSLFRMKGTSPEAKKGTASG